ncbi:PAS domain S-box protein [Marinobacter goseongensis]|uniref:PAS domain S-box protein n=1 Tax=Marinobacter goseongensis TaxID=453838 RepID=UPI00200678ED|nr:PAS domain S-box protein [Marinobacter goseongensis]MCK7550677.1 PAS domain-containing protein [Marinobacter goseongensis]
MATTHGYRNAESHDRLRRSARDLIEHGVPPRNHGGTLSVDALQLLYERASQPDSAADALKLLHELQTYQVELDLLYEQLQANELEIVEELTHYKSLYEQAPVSYLIVANDGEIIEGNQAAETLFGEGALPLTGKALSALLAPGQELAILTLLGRAAEDAPGTPMTASLPVELADHRPLIICARPAIAGDSILMVLSEFPPQTASF